MYTDQICLDILHAMESRSQNERRCHILDLPAEIRLLIYEFTTCSQDEIAYEIPSPEDDPPPLQHLCISISGHQDPVLLQICHKMHDEVQGEVRKGNLRRKPLVKMFPEAEELSLRYVSVTDLERILQGKEQIVISYKEGLDQDYVGWSRGHGGHQELVQSLCALLRSPRIELCLEVVVAEPWCWPGRLQDVKKFLAFEPNSNGVEEELTVVKRLFRRKSLPTARFVVTFRGHSEVAHEYGADETVVLNDPTGSQDPPGPYEISGTPHVLPLGYDAYQAAEAIRGEGSIAVMRHSLRGVTAKWQIDGAYPLLLLSEHVDPILINGHLGRPMTIFMPKTRSLFVQTAARGKCQVMSAGPKGSHSSVTIIFPEEEEGATTTKSIETVLLYERSTCKAQDQIA